MGVLGWTPQTVMRDATLQDLLDAWCGYNASGQQPMPASFPPASFLADMMSKFPDLKGKP